MVSPLEAPVFFYLENDFFNLVNANLKKKKKFPNQAALQDQWVFHLTKWNPN